MTTSTESHEIANWRSKRLDCKSAAAPAARRGTGPSKLSFVTEELFDWVVHPTKLYSPIVRTVLAAAALATLSCKTAAPTPPASTPLVVVAPVIQRDVPIYMEWVGTTEGFINADIYPKISGYLIKQNYRDGDFVHAGQLLFQIDPREYQAALDQAVATRDQQQATFKQNHQDLVRYTTLYREQVISKQDFQHMTQGTQESQAAVEAAQAAVEKARLYLEWTKVNSPIDGIAGIAKTQVGDLVSPSSLLTSVSQLEPIKVEFPISEQTYLGFADKINRDLDPRATESTKFELILSNGTSYKYPGRVYDINRQVDIQTGTIVVEATFPNPHNFLRPGQYAKVRAATEVQHHALLVPQDAVLETQGQYQVAVVGSDNKVTMRTADIGKRVGGLRIIAKGVSSGERVITEGLEKVHDGMEVNPHLVLIQTESSATTTSGGRS